MVLELLSVLLSSFLSLLTLRHSIIIRIRFITHMPCLCPLTIKNPKYLPNEKNGGHPPTPIDPRLRYIQVPCGTCLECRRRRASDWRFRAHQEYRYNKDRFYFITMTFDDDNLQDLLEEFGDSEYNYTELVTKAVRRFLERYRKEFKVSLKHLFVTELGEKNDRIHIHGIICGPKNKDMKLYNIRKSGRKNVPVYRCDSLARLWKYGFIYLEGCDEEAISYILKYLTKLDEKHSWFKSTLLVSPGFGKGYVNGVNKVWHHSTKDGIWYCLASSGWKVAMPRYYKDKIFSERERSVRTLKMLDDPPPLVFHGKEFDSFEAYHLFMVHYYVKTLRLGTSYVKNRKEFEPFVNEILESSDF